MTITNSCRSGRAEAFQARERGVSPDVFYTAGPAPSHSHDPVGIMVSRQVVRRGNIQGVDRGDGLSEVEIDLVFQTENIGFRSQPSNPINQTNQHNLRT